MVYEIPCNNYDKLYIGKTSEHLQDRINVYKYDKKNKIATTYHCDGTNHTFNYYEHI